MSETFSVSLVLPVLDEEEGLKKILPVVPDIVSEVIVSDNGSCDKSADVARQYGAKVVSVSLRGYGAALSAGIAAAKGDIVLFMDADATNPPREIPMLIEPILSGTSDFVSGSREFKNRGVCSICGNLVMRLLVKILYRINLQDTQSGMCAFRKDIFSVISSTSKGMSFSQEIKLNAYLSDKVRTAEIPVSSHKREGVMKYRVFADSMANVYNFWRFYFVRKNK